MDEVSNRVWSLRLMPTPSVIDRTSEASQPTTAIRANWRQLLQDLTSFDVVELAAANACAMLTTRGEPWYAYLDGDVAVLQGPGVYFVGLTRHWVSAQIGVTESDPVLERLTVLDRRGKSLWSVSLTEDSAATCTYRSYVPLWVTEFESQTADTPLWNRHVDDLQALQRCGADWLSSDVGNPWYGTTAGPKPGLAVDPTLIAPFLETMVDQACPLRAVLGNEGLIQAYNAEYYDMRQTRDEVDLRSSSSKLTLNFSQLGSVRVDRSKADASAHRIYIFDSDDHCALRMQLGPGASQACCSLWQTMTKALIG